MEVLAAPPCATLDGGGRPFVRCHGRERVPRFGHHAPVAREGVTGSVHHVSSPGSQGTRGLRGELEAAAPSLCSSSIAALWGGLDRRGCCREGGRGAEGACGVPGSQGRGDDRREEGEGRVRRVGERGLNT